MVSSLLLSSPPPLLMPASLPAALPGCRLCPARAARLPSAHAAASVLCSLSPALQRASRARVERGRAGEESLTAASAAY